MKKAIIGSILIMALSAQANTDSNVAMKKGSDFKEKQRVLVSTDIGGTDPDDNQSMAHLLMYTDCFDLEGIVSSPSFGSGNKEEILRMIDLFEKDMPKLSKHIDGLMAPDRLRAITKQGRKGAAPYRGYTTPTEGSEWIVKCGRRKSDRPLWISVWGGLEDVAQALHDAPDIADKIRIYWIGGPNKKWSTNSYAYIVENFPDLFMIEANAAYRGFISENKNPDKFNAGFYDTYLKGAGNIGEDFMKYYKGIPKMGDTPALLYVMDGEPDNPRGESWGGSFEPAKRSSHQVFHRPTTENDTVPVYSIIELHIKGPVKHDIAPDSVCFQMDIRNQKWDGYYLSNGDYAVRHSTYYLGTLPYKITSHIPDFPQYEAAITVENKWPGRKNPSDYKVGDNWYTDKSAPESFLKKHQGAQTVFKWRNAAMEDWGNRLNYLKESNANIQAREKRQWGEWTTWGEQPDGTYHNPIIPSDYSDLDCIRVGDDYYAISSTMQFSPGMTLLHSKDLVNWEICTNIITDLTQIGPELGWQRMNRRGRGVWAGTLRHHNGRFYLFFGTPDEGYFMTSAPRPEGPWEPLTSLLDEPGWDDCTAAWDEKGNARFVGTHFADGYKTYMFKMSADGKSIDRRSAKLINQGNHREASKLIKVGDWWYLVFSEHKGSIGRYVMAKRSKHIDGPYKEEKQLALASRDANEPNQGGIIEGKDGNWYFLTHHGKGDWSGRIVSLLPVSWIDGWPVIGEVLPEKIGTMQWNAPMPAIEKEKLHIRRSDDFDTTTLAPQWQWNYQPRSEMFSLTERPGWLRLKAFRPIETNQLLKAGNTLTQRSFRTPSNCVTVKMDISRMTDGQKAGLCHISNQSSAIGVAQKEGKRRLEYRRNDNSTLGKELSQKYIWLQSRWGLDGISRYYYSLDGEIFHPFGEPSQMVWGSYRGDRVGIYTFNDDTEDGCVDVDYLHYPIM